jgi:hypothetical protein
MLKRIQPEVGSWYENTDQNLLFEVVFFDEDESSVGIQYFDGEIEELELEGFLKLPLKAVRQPEDWSGPYEVDEADNEPTEYPFDPSDGCFSFDEYESGSVRVHDDF